VNTAEEALEKWRTNMGAQQAGFEILTNICSSIEGTHDTRTQHDIRARARAHDTLTQHDTHAHNTTHDTHAHDVDEA
jgi:hypothetical protein